MGMRETAQRWMMTRERVSQGRERNDLALCAPSMEEFSRDEGLVDLVHKAWEDWQAAQNYFEAVSDPELVDYAIYGLEAARRKYIYLLRRAGEDERDGDEGLRRQTF